MASAEDQAQALRTKFAGEGWLAFDVVGGIVRIRITTRAANAAIFLQGAHLAAWEPAGETPAIFMPRKGRPKAGEPIRGGVPVIFPWFGPDPKPDRIDGHPGPSHGFARLDLWTFASARMHGDQAELVFTLGPSALSRSMGFDAFALTLTFTIGHELNMALDVRNTGSAPLEFEEGLHTYYQVTDVYEAEILGLESTGYVNKTDHYSVMPAEHHPMHFTQFTDSIFQDTEGPYVIRDVAGRREIHVRKEGSKSTVVWNPFRESAEIGPWDWHEFVAVETLNIEKNRVTLAAGESHRMVMHATVRKAQDA